MTVLCKRTPTQSAHTGYTQGCRCDECAQARHDYYLRTAAKTAARRDALLERQGGRCAICGTADPGHAKGWQIDHDHACCPQAPTTSCGYCDRGVLCASCNIKLAGFEAFRKNTHVLRYLGCLT